MGDSIAPEYEELHNLGERVQIVADLILQAPPGEFNEVFNDVRILLNDDILLKGIIPLIFSVYFKEQLTPARIKDSEHRAVITRYNDLGDGRFYDPRSRQSFRYLPVWHHTTDYRIWVPDFINETWRKAIEDSWTVYVKNHYKYGVCSVFGKDEEGLITITACGENHKYEPKSFWTGRFRSIWTVSFTPDSGTAVLKGILKIQIHYCEEDGNVQLATSKEITESLTISSQKQTAMEFVQICEMAEREYQIAITENYQCMSDTTFKAFRRRLPVTRSKIDWSKIFYHRVLGELKIYLLHSAFEY